MLQYVITNTDKYNAILCIYILYIRVYTSFVYTRMYTSRYRRYYCMYSRLSVVNFLRSQKYTRRRVYRESASGHYLLIPIIHILLTAIMRYVSPFRLIWHGMGVLIQTFFIPFDLVFCCWRRGRPGRGRECMLNCGVPFGRT